MLAVAKIIYCVSDAARALYIVVCVTHICTFHVPSSGSLNPLSFLRAHHDRLCLLARPLCAQRRRSKIATANAASRASCRSQVGKRRKTSRSTFQAQFVPGSKTVLEQTTCHTRMKEVLGIHRPAIVDRTGSPKTGYLLKRGHLVPPDKQLFNTSECRP